MRTFDIAATIPFCEAAASHSGSATALRSYVADEIERAREAGAPLLTLILTMPDTAARAYAMDSIASLGQPIMLRLVPDVTPPARDAQARLLPEGKRGRVLRAKVGTLGGAVASHNGEVPGEVAMQHSSTQMNSRAATRRDIYRYVEIGSAPVAVTHNDACAVLAQWGWGIIADESRHHVGGEVDESGRPTGKQFVLDRWLVEEVCEMNRAQDQDTSPRGGSKASRASDARAAP